MSTKSVAEVLLMEPNATGWSLHTSRPNLTEPPPEGVRRVDGPEQATTVLVFADDAGLLRDMIAAHKDQLARLNALWIAYPKTNRAGINRDTLWPIVAEYGLRPIGQVAMDGV